MGKTLMSEEVYDIVSVGAGAAGCVVASYLAEHIDASIALIEGATWIAIPCSAVDAYLRPHPASGRVTLLTVPAKPVDATQALNLSAGVSNCKVSRGRSFS